MIEEKKYQMCEKTVMDTTDPDIIFDENGICNHYHSAKKQLDYFDKIDRKKHLDNMIQKVKSSKASYDSIIGLSGGVDSSYLLYYLVKNYQINPLVVHIDGGWNTEISQWNVENLIKKLDLDLYTYVVNWKEMRDLQLSFLKSNTENQDIPQDHAFFSKLYDIGIKEKIKYIITGSNLVSESILPFSWGYYAIDDRFLKSIHKKFGKIPLKSFPTLSFFRYYFLMPLLYRIKILKPLNLIDYDPEKAKSILMKEIGFKDYGKKHNESSFTKFFQNYYLYEKFGIDKRKAHLSSLILSNKISREEALNLLNVKPYDDNLINNEKEFIAKKLNISKIELDNFIAAPNRHFTDYPNNYKFYQLKSRLKSKLIGN
tara:strand:+ start:75 stop:1187 length:1113 start_codon:yes stop_codon:yes gene_type:complete